MTDEQLLDRLRADLDAFVGEPGPAPAIAPPASRRPVWVPVAAAAAVLALVVAGLVVLTRDRTDRTMPLGPAIVEVGKPVPPTPDGWTVVEWGDVRISLPPDLEPYGPGCTSEASDEITVVLVCGDRVLTIVSGGAGEPDPELPVTVRNGLPTALVPTPDLDETSSQLLIGETTSLVRFTGFGADDVDAIAATVGVSSAWRARLEPAPPVPDDWQTVELPGVSFRVPPDWVITAMTPEGFDPDLCGFAGVQPGVLLGRGSFAGPTMNCAPAGALRPGIDGVRVFPLGDGPGPLGNPFFEAAIDSVGPTQVVRVGLAGDGTIGRTIIGSITAPGRVPTPAAPVITTPVPTATATAPEFQTTGSVFETDDGEHRLCFGFDDALVAPCTDFVTLAGWSWDLVDDEREVRGFTTAEHVYLVGTFDEAAQRLSVAVARTPTSDDLDRIIAAAAPRVTDNSIPCEPPVGGWPTVVPDDRTPFPLPEAARIDGFVGSWINEPTGVVVIRTSADVDEFDGSLRTIYGGPVCVTGAERSLAELITIRSQLLGLSSVRVLGAAVLVDASGEWVTATTVLPEPELQAAFDAEFGAGVVRLGSVLLPYPG